MSVGEIKLLQIMLLVKRTSEGMIWDGEIEHIMLSVSIRGTSEILKFMFSTLTPSRCNSFVFIISFGSGYAVSFGLLSCDLQLCGPRLWWISILLAANGETFFG